MNNTNITEEQIEIMLTQLGLTEIEKLSYRQKLLQKNNLNSDNLVSSPNNEAEVPNMSSNVLNRKEPVLNNNDFSNTTIETVVAPVILENNNKRASFFTLAKSFIPFFSQKYKNKVTKNGESYIQKTALHAVTDNNGATLETQKSFMDNIKAKAYNLGVTVSQINSSWNNANINAGQKFVKIMKLSGEATAVEKVEAILKESIKDNKLKAESTGNSTLIMEEVDENLELSRFASEHAEKYSYEYDLDGAIVFKNFVEVNADSRFMYVKRNFSHDVKSELINTIQYLEALDKSKMTKNIILLNNYAKSIDVFPGEIMKLLNESATGSNLPSHPLLEKVLQNRVEILNDSVNISNEMVKARVKENYLISISKKLIDYIDNIPVNDLSQANKEMRKSFKFDFLNTRIGARKIGESINQHIGYDEILDKLNISSGTEVKKTSVEKANDLASSMNQSIAGFMKEIEDIHSKYTEYQNKIESLSKLENPSKAQMKDIINFKEEMKLYFTKYNATYQSFVEEHNKNFADFEKVIQIIRNAKHSVKQGNLSNKEYFSLKSEADRHNSNLLSGASSVVSHVVDTIGGLGTLKEQVYSHIIGNAGMKFRDMDRLSDNYKELDEKFLSDEENKNKKIYGAATDLMVAYKELTETFVKINEHIDLSEGRIISLNTKTNRIEDSEISELKKSDVANCHTSIKNTVSRFNDGKNKLEEEFDLKFSAFRRLFLTTPNAKHAMKSFSKMGDFDISLWIDSADPLERLDNGFEISKNKMYSRIEGSLENIINKKDTVVLKKLNALIEISQNNKDNSLDVEKNVKVKTPRKRKLASDISNIETSIIPQTKIITNKDAEFINELNGSSNTSEVNLQFKVNPNIEKLNDRLERIETNLNIAPKKKNP